MNRDQYTKLENLPNIGPAIAANLRSIGIVFPQDLCKQDPYVLYEKLCRKTFCRQDLCVLDIFISAVRFMQGEPARPWWHYTQERKQKLSVQTGKRLILQSKTGENTNQREGAKKRQ